MSSYIHGSAPEEQARLAKLNELINSRCLDILDIRGAERILDVGCGLGQFTMAMAAVAGPQGMCLGIERDENQLKIAGENLRHGQEAVGAVTFRQGNVENLELREEEWGSFDLAHARFVIEHVRQPEKVVEGMARAVRPGGRVVLADDDHENMRLYPDPPGFRTLWQAYMQSYVNLGNDPLIGRRLVSILHDCKLTGIRTNVVFFGDSASSSTFPAYAKNLIGILLGAKDLMLKLSLIDEADFDAAIRELHQWSRNPAATLWYTINWAEGRR